MYSRIEGITEYQHNLSLLQFSGARKDEYACARVCVHVCREHGKMSMHVHMFVYVFERKIYINRS